MGNTKQILYITALFGQSGANQVLCNVMSLGRGEGLFTDQCRLQRCTQATHKGVGGRVKYPEKTIM